jgi:transitional endoplasmic reticulum ATPase
VDPSEIIRTLRHAVAAQPENVSLQLLLAEALLGTEALDQAEEAFRSILQAAPQNGRAQLGLGQVFIAQNKLAEAEVLVEAAFERDPGPRALIVRSRLRLGRGELRAAAQDYSAALDLDPDVADPTLAERLEPYMRRPAPVGEGPADPSDSDIAGAAVEQVDLVNPVERPGFGFDAIGGMDQIKDAVRMMIIAPIEQPELYAAYGKSAGGGILLYGPPGCGKTHIARATAGQIRSSFLSVGLNDVLDMWLGNSEKRLHEIFEQARRQQPCVLFFDEVDALGGNRGSFTGNAGRNVVNQFLAEMDGLGGRNDGVLILAATNAPWHVDAAFRRPGRFDRVLFVPPPDEEARAAILGIHLEGKPTDGIDTRSVAAATKDFSGADMRAVIDHAVEQKLRDAMRTGQPTALTTADLLAAARRVHPTTSEWFGTARNYAIHANQTGAYDDIAAYLGLR